MKALSILMLFVPISTQASYWHFEQVLKSWPLTGSSRTPATTIVEDDELKDVLAADLSGKVNEQEEGDGFQRIWSGLPVREFCSSMRSVANSYMTINLFRCSGRDEEYPDGFSLKDGPGHPYLGNAESPYDSNQKPQRGIDFHSRNHASNETFLYLTDQAGGPDSHDVKSIVLLLPRKVVPSIKVVEDKIYVTLTTGEEVIFDRKSRAIISGALREGPIDLTTDRFKRTPPNIHYQGQGISIRLDHRFEYPTLGSATALVEQNGKSCKVPRTKLYSAEGKLLTESDEELVQVLNQNCPKNRFTL